MTKIRILEFDASVHFLFFLHKINFLTVYWSSDVKNEEAEADFDDPCRELLENIAIEQKFEVTYVDVEELSKKVIFLKKNIVIFENRFKSDCIRM